MKIYLLYLLPQNKLYAVTSSKKYMKQFLEERNSKCFNVIKRKFDDEDAKIFLDSNSRLKLDTIPLEDLNGDYSIIGTIEENYTINCVCENMAESCYHLKLHFMENIPFKDEYIELLDNLTTISKNINCHSIIQIDSVKLFYFLFKETFTILDEDDYLIDTDEYLNEIISAYRSHR